MLTASLPLITAAALALGDWPVLHSPSPRDADMDAFLPLVLRKALVTRGQEVCLGVTEGVAQKVRDPSDKVFEEATRQMPGGAVLWPWSACVHSAPQKDGGSSSARLYVVAQVERPKPNQASVYLGVRCGFLCGYAQAFEVARAESGWRVLGSQVEEETPDGLSPDTFLQDGWGQSVETLRKRFADASAAGTERWCRKHFETRLCFQFQSGRLAEVEVRLEHTRNLLHSFNDAFGPPDRVVPSVSGVDYLWKRPYEYDVRLTQAAGADGTDIYQSTKRILWSAPPARAR